MKPPEVLKVAILGDEELTEVLDHSVGTFMIWPNPYSLCTQFAKLEPIGQSTAHVQGVTRRMLQIQTGNDDTEPLMIETSLRGGEYETPNPLQLHCSEAQAFIMTFSINSRTSFDSIEKDMDAIVKAGRRVCPIALVGMQKMHKSVVVSMQEASDRAADLGAEFFSVQTTVSNQVMAPFVYLGQRHFQGRNEASWSLKIGELLRPRAWHSWIWPCCLSRGRKARSNVWF